MRKSVLDFWVGLFVLVGIIALLFLAKSQFVGARKLGDTAYLKG